MKSIIVGAVLCLLGAVAIDCGISATGFMAISLGIFAILFGPLVTEL